MLDTQVYSNTGGQASTSSFTGQNTKMSVHGKAIDGKQERRKEIAQIAMMHPRTLRRPDDLRPHQPLLQVGARRAGVRRPGDRRAATRPASRSTAWPTTWPASRPGWRSIRGRSRCLIYDPRAGDTIKKRLSLQGNPAVKDDWFINPKTSEEVDFIDFARSEGRFAKHFDKDGNPSETLLMAKQDRLENWHAAAGAGGAAVTICE